MFSWSIFLGESTSRSCGSFWRDYGGSSWGEARYMIAIQAIFRPTFPPHRGAHGDREQPLQVWPSCCSSGWSWSCTRVEEPFRTHLCLLSSFDFGWTDWKLLLCTKPRGLKYADFAVDDWNFYHPHFQNSFEVGAPLQMAKWGEGDPRCRVLFLGQSWSELF